MDRAKREAAAPLDLWDAFDELRGELEKSFGSLDVPGMTGLLDWQMGPAVDIVEGNDEILVLADLPGVRKENLELTVADGLLTLKGDKLAEPSENKRRIVRKETWSGGFSRTIGLPETVNPDKVEAMLKDGILRVRIAKREEAKPRKIQISVK